MFGELWNSAKDDYLLQKEKQAEERRVQKKRIQQREQDRAAYQERLSEFRSRKGTHKKDNTMLRQSILKDRLNKNVLRDIELAKRSGINKILKCPKFIKFTKSRFKVDDQFKLYIEWELLKTNQLDKTQTIGITFQYHTINDTPAKLVEELQNDLKQLKYWVGEDCKEYLFEYLTSVM